MLVKTTAKIQLSQTFDKFRILAWKSLTFCGKKKKEKRRIKIPHTGDTESLDRCG